MLLTLCLSSVDHRISEQSDTAHLQGAKLITDKSCVSVLCSMQRLYRNWTTRWCSRYAEIEERIASVIAQVPSVFVAFPFAA